MSSRKREAVAQAAIGDNSKRSLADIAEDIRTKERDAIFDIGALLIEAHAACEHGTWQTWLDDEFSDWSDDTARNYMTAAELAAKTERIRFLKIPVSIIYQLDPDDPHLHALVAALDKASKKERLSAVEAQRVIRYAELRIDHGDCPNATLDAIAFVSYIDPPWKKKAIEELKAAQPKNEDDATKIVTTVRREHIKRLFKAKLPDWVDDAHLANLEIIEPEHRERVAQKLQGMTEEPARGFYDFLLDVINEQDDGEGVEPPATPAPMLPPSEPTENASEPTTTEADADLIEALRVIVHHAKRPMPTSIGDIKNFELVEAAQFIEKLRRLTTDNPDRWRESA